MKRLGIVDNNRLRVQIEKQFGKLLWKIYKKYLTPDSIKKMRNEYVLGIIEKKWSPVSFSSKNKLSKQSFLTAKKISHNTDINKMLVINYLMAVIQLSRLDRISKYELNPLDKSVFDFKDSFNSSLKWGAFGLAAILAIRVLK